jgi:Fibronectin type III domain
VIAHAFRLATATAVLIGLVAAPALGDSTDTTNSAGITPTARAERPVQVLPRDLRGRAAINALGSQLTAVAAQNDLSPSSLTTILTEDTTAWLSEEGQMFYKEEMPGFDEAAPTPPGEAPSVDVSPGSTEQATGSGTGSTLVPAYPVSQTFKLHSRPSATKVIFLDFDGAEVKGTGWNTGKTPIGSAAYTGYTQDGNSATFNTAENAWIQEVWRQVAETYAAFDVDVTTEDGGSDSRTRSSNLDTHYGTQVLFTNSAQAVAQACNSTCLGVAWVGTFSDVDPVGYYQPAWVFTKTDTSATVAAQGASHEAGHTLGLHHDGLNKADYYQGTKAWGPIMGSAYTRAVSQFSKGEYAGATQKEDDLAVIAANGLPLRADDYGNTSQSAKALGVQASYAANGVISTRSDTDVFAIDLRCTTDLTVTATGIGPQAALDLRLDVLNGSGATVTSSSPASSYSTASPPVSTGMNASASVRGAIGTYYLRVDGVGNGSPTGSGWSDYGSLGQYHLRANGCTDATTQPVQTPTPGQTNQTPTLTRPSAPRIGKASPGAKGGKSTAVVRWLAPTRNGGAAVTKYRVIAKRVDANGRVVRSYNSAYQKPAVRQLAMKVPKARYRFVVIAWNRVGASPASKVSNIANAR